MVVMAARNYVRLMQLNMLVIQAQIQTVTAVVAVIAKCKS